jgi:hypothetical protein
MLKFINKKGKTIVELRDNGDMLVTEAKLHEALKPTGQVINESVEETTEEDTEETKDEE